MNSLQLLKGCAPHSRVDQIGVCVRSSTLIAEPVRLGKLGVVPPTRIERATNGLGISEWGEFWHGRCCDRYLKLRRKKAERAIARTTPAAVNSLYASPLNAPRSVSLQVRCSGLVLIAASAWTDDKVQFVAKRLWTSTGQCTSRQEILLRPMKKSRRSPR